MANIKKAEEDQKNKIITVRLTAEQRKMIEKASAENGMNMSEFMLAKAIQKGGVQVRKENNRICKLVNIEEDLGVLKERIKVKHSNIEILEAINHLEQEIINLWRC